MFGGAGRVVLEDLRKQYVYRDVFHRDPLVMAARAAERDLIERIGSILKVDPEDVPDTPAYPSEGREPEDKESAYDA